MEILYISTAKDIWIPHLLISVFASQEYHKTILYTSSQLEEDAYSNVVISCPYADYGCETKQVREFIHKMVFSDPFHRRFEFSQIPIPRLSQTSSLRGLWMNFINITQTGNQTCRIDARNIRVGFFWKWDVILLVIAIVIARINLQEQFIAHLTTTQLIDWLIISIDFSSRLKILRSTYQISLDVIWNYVRVLF